MLPAKKIKNKWHASVSAINEYANTLKFNRTGKLAKIIAFANHKGGVGKTTIVMNLAAALREKRRKILVIDIDPQENLTMTIGNELEENFNIYTYLQTDNANIIDFIYSKDDFIHYIPASLLLANYEREPDIYHIDKYKLKNGLELLKTEYDFILIDCPPQLSLLNDVGIIASDYFISPIMPDSYSIAGLTKFISVVAPQSNSTIFAGTVLSRYAANRAIDKMILEDLEFLPDVKYTGIIIQESTEIVKSSMKKISVFELLKKDTKSKRDFRKLADYVENIGE